MGPDAGIWVPYRPGLRRDPRVLAAVSHLAGPLAEYLRDAPEPTLVMVARALAEQAVVGAFLDLSCSALSDGYDDGLLDGLTDARLAMVAAPGRRRERPCSAGRPSGPCCGRR